MAFRINDFKAGMDKFGGPSHASLFEVIFTLNGDWAPNSRATSRDLTFFCNAAAIPGMQVETAVYQGVAQKAKTFARGLSHDQVSCNFMLDSDHQIKAFFHSWMQRVVNYSTSGGNFSEVNGMLPYEVGYKDEYSMRMTIRHYTTYARDGYYEVILDNAFPVALGDVDLAWGNEGVATMGVGFQYDRIEYAGEVRGNPTTGRGNGILDLLNGIDVISQTFRLGRPDSVQDAINRFNRVSNAWDQITNIFNF